MLTFLRILSCCVILISIAGFSQPALSKPGVLPTGEAELNGFPIPGVGYLVPTAYNLYVDGHLIFKPSDVIPNDRIVSVHRRIGTPDEIIITLSKGFAYTYRISKSGQQFTFTQIRISAVTIYNYATANQTVGATAYYMLTSQAPYSSRDSLSLFQIDTAGIGLLSPSGIALDAAKNAYISTSNGLYKQHPENSGWTRVTQLTLASNLSAVFVDRTGGMFVGSSKGVCLSTDDGATWGLDTAGMGAGIVSVFADDGSGNVYAAHPISPDHNYLYKSSGGTGPWTRIDASILAITGRGPKYNEISENGTIYATTPWGGFISTDQGTSWTKNDAGVLAENYSGFVRLPSGTFFISTSLGIFRLVAGSTQWSKVYPAVGYQSFLPMYIDNVGGVYTSNPPYTKSTDDGMTWFADTLGLGTNLTGSFYVDETGTEHRFGFQYGGSFYSFMLKKDPDQSWTTDSAGFPYFNNSYTSVMASNNRGWLFASGSYISGGITYPKVFKRPIGGGTWIADTAGLPQYVSSFNFLLPDQSGNMFGWANGVLYHQEAGIWKQKTSPPGSINSYKLTIDSTGRLYADRNAFFASGLSSTGISVSTDNGATWQAATHDTTTIFFARSFGDTTVILSTKGFTILVGTNVVGILALQSAVGWNMISVPYVVSDFHKNVLFPTATTPAFSYNGGYVGQSILQNGTGYWLKFSASAVNPIVGAVMAQETVAVASGWNMIAVPSSPVLAANISKIGTSIVTPYYGYAGSYYTEDTLRPGHAYWGKTSGAGELLLSGSPGIGKNAPQAKEDFSELTITDGSGNHQTLYIGETPGRSPESYEMPPLPPGGIFDARFASNRIAEFVGADRSKDVSILLTSASNPVSFAFESATYAASILSGGKTIPLRSHTALRLAEDQRSITIRISQGIVRPLQFSLGQNYPNPFNPRTEIRYQIAEAQLVTVNIYDVLGRVVAQLVNEERTPGEFSLTWDATNFSSGMYFYELRAGSFQDVKKLLLIK